MATSAACLNFPREYDLLEHFKLNFDAKRRRESWEPVDFGHALSNAEPMVAR
ncbi:MAG: hypothetical protein Q8Q59_14845 [Luteolibacter sp.]|jgi:hypothetical protein|nr:hypothetical protein [Luteolibacter sp.]